MPDNITPEEKLLNLIKKGGKEQEEDKKTPLKDTKDKPAPVRGEVKKTESKPKQAFPTSPKKTKEKKKAPKIVVPKGKKLRNPFDLLNKVLIVVIIGAIVYFILGYIFPYKPQIEISGEMSISKAKGVADSEMEALPPLSHYTGTVGKRQMFKVYEVPKPKAKGPVKPKVTLQQLLSGYTFVGIIFGEPSQAIIEEKRSKQSYYLSPGQNIGEIKIEKVERGKVTVSYDDEVMDIRI